MKIKEITQAIEAYAPLELQESFDNAGVQVGDVEREVTGVLLCTDVREPIVAEALELGCNLIISHHPLIFHAIKKLDGSDYVKRIVAMAIKHDLTIYAAHTNMDITLGGVNHKMAEKLALTGVEVLDDTGEQDHLGVIGDLPVPLDALDFLRRVKDAFGCAAVRYSGDTARPVSRVALCGGSGAFLKAKAIARGAHAFVTADVKYHEFMGDEDRLLLADIGHYESEQFTKEIFCDIICKKNPNFAVHFAKNEQNQLKYLI